MISGGPLSALESYDDVADREKKGKQSAPGEAWVAVRLPESAKNLLEEIAHHEDRSVSYVLRRIVLEALDRYRSES